MNVGGSIFETSLSTLCRDSKSLLAVMFSGRHELSVESDGSYFIDRDPTHFRLVLNYLRDLRVTQQIPISFGYANCFKRYHLSYYKTTQCKLTKRVTSLLITMTIEEKNCYMKQGITA